jgi:hypothetical protein
MNNFIRGVVFRGLGFSRGDSEQAQDTDSWRVACQIPEDAAESVLMEPCQHCKLGHYKMESLASFYDQEGHLVEIYQCSHCKRVLVIQHTED